MLAALAGQTEQLLPPLLFADDFAGLSDTLPGLQAVVDVTKAWCAKWRMQANIGPSKSAVMVFGRRASAPAPAIRWGRTLLPVVSS